MQPQTLSTAAQFDMMNVPWLLAQVTEAASTVVAREMGSSLLEYSQVIDDGALASFSSYEVPSPTTWAQPCDCL